MKQETNLVWEKLVPWGGSESRDTMESTGYEGWGHEESGTGKQELGMEVYTLRRDEGLGMSMSIVQEVWKIWPLG